MILITLPWQVRLVRYPFVTGTRGLPLRDIPSALYEFLWGRWVDWMVGFRWKVDCTQDGL